MQREYAKYILEVNVYPEGQIERRFYKMCRKKQFRIKWSWGKQVLGKEEKL